MEQTIVITMAGAGSRFKKAGYRVPKYEIVVKGYPLFIWAVQSLIGFNTSLAKWIFVAQAHDRAEDFIARECKKLGIKSWQLVEIDCLTDGQATTVLHAKQGIEKLNLPICIYNIDTFVSSDSLSPDRVSGDGWIPCFLGKGDHWSFVRTDDNGLVIDVREKQRISEQCSIGLYWFSSFLLYQQTYQEFYGNSDQINCGEKFIAPMYNQLIAKGKNVYIHSIPSENVIALGTPEEVQNFSKSTFSPRIGTGLLD